MSNAALLLAANTPAIVCVSFAGHLAATGSDVWGWFLFLGVCCVGSLRSGGSP